MQQTFLNILKKYFNLVKGLADFCFCLVGYIWPKSIKDDAVLAMIKKTLYFIIIIIIIGKE